MNRREFAASAPGLLAFASALASPSSIAQAPAAPAAKPLPRLASGTYPPGPLPAKVAPRMSRQYLAGMLAGNIRLEMHTTTQEPGAPHEAVGSHLHNEIWLMREGTASLTTNGVARRMEPGDVGLCCAGDQHFIENVGPGRCTYFVVTVGPPENPQDKS